MLKSEIGIVSASKRVNFITIPYISIYNGDTMYVMHMIMTDLSHSSLIHVWLLIAIEFILSQFSVCYIIVRQFLYLSLNFTGVSLNKD